MLISVSSHSCPRKDYSWFSINSINTKCLLFLQDLVNFCGILQVQGFILAGTEACRGQAQRSGWELHSFMSFLPFFNLLILSFLGEESKNTFNSESRCNALGSVFKNITERFSVIHNFRTWKNTFKLCCLDLLSSRIGQNDTLPSAGS